MKSKRKILVIGGTRFFGKNLVRNLMDRGDDVTIATRGLSHDDFSGHVKRLKIERGDVASLQSAFSGQSWDVVYDQICYSPDDAKALLESLRDSNARIIHTSTQSVYITNNRQVEDDFDPYKYDVRYGNKSDFSYGEGKRLAEAVYFHRSKNPVTAVRLPYVLGKDDYTGRLDFHVDRIRAGKPFVFENLDALTSFIHAKEAAKFLEWIGDQEFTGPINACSVGEISYRQLFSLIEKSTGMKVEIRSPGSKDDVSPYSTKISRYMDLSKATKLGFQFSHWSDWLPALIEDLAK